MKKMWVHLTAGSLLLAIGLILFCLPAFIRHQQASQTATPPVSTAQVVKTELAPQAISGQPVRLQIPSLGLDLPIINGYYDAQHQAWTLTNTSVQFAAMTTPPNNQAGLTFMYAHARKGLFATLPKITDGATVLVTTANNHTFTYQYRSSQTVKPQESSFLKYHGAPILVLQTCTGLFYQNRQLFTFVYQGVA